MLTKPIRSRSWIVAGRALLQIVSFQGIVGRRTAGSRRHAAVEINERLLRRIGADLHDGPTQLISLSLLRLNSLRSVLASERATVEEFEKIEALLQDCLREIRHMSSGLAPPHLESLPLQGVLELAVRQHEQRTGTAVNVATGRLPKEVPTVYKISIYRFVQQALHNAYSHAEGAGQRVRASSAGGMLTVQVSDSGPGFLPLKAMNKARLGLACMRDRIESLGGTFRLETHLNSGTTLRASFKLDDVVKSKKAGGRQ